MEHAEEIKKVVREKYGAIAEENARVQAELGRPVVIFTWTRWMPFWRCRVLSRPATQASPASSISGSRRGMSSWMVLSGIYRSL